MFWLKSVIFRLVKISGLFWLNSVVFNNARIESFNGVFKTEALYASLGKTKVNSHVYTARELAAKAEWFIPYYNDKRRKDGLNHMTPVEYRESNRRGTYPVVVENNL